jgi:SPP1 gp7 family putative phage head morphogenesis protein
MLEDMIRECSVFLAMKAVDPTASVETALERKLAGLFNKVIRETLTRLQDANTSNDPASVTRAFQIVERDWARTVAEVVLAAPEIKVNSAATQSIIDHVFEASQKTLARMRSTVMDVIAEGTAQGDGIKTIARSLRDVSDGMKKYELNRVARTEVKGAYGDSNFAQQQQAGIQYTQWVAAGDDRVRDSHLEQNGLIVRLGDTFPNELKYPGDRSGDLEEWINCRCVGVSFIMPRGFMAPVGKPSFYEDEIVSIAEAA